MADTDEKIKISGNVGYVKFRNDNNGYTVFSLETKAEEITVVGTAPDIKTGDKVEIIGSYTYHSIYGQQIKADSVVPAMPETIFELLKYLQSGAIKGVGKATGKAIIDKFGEESFNILENSPERLAEVKGISKKKAVEIGAEYNKQFNARLVLISLASLDLSTDECLLAFKKFGDNAAIMVKENPYILCFEGGISFERADRIAEILPERPQESDRIEACLIYTLRHNLSNGHTCIPEGKLIDTVASYVENTSDNVEIALDNLIEKGILYLRKFKDKRWIFLPESYFAESAIAKTVSAIAATPQKSNVNLEKFFNKKGQIQYAELQKNAIEIAVNIGALILTGGPGTGKTTTLKGIIELFEKDDLSIALCAPTGRAAQRMTEATGREAMTIHRLLEVDWKDDFRPFFKRNAKNPIKKDVIIVDEMSMVDIFLFDSLLQAVKLGTRLILVGDSDQLPSVNAGNVLKDLIAAEAMPIVELKEIFRQAAESNIVMNAHRIVTGEHLVNGNFEGDFFLIKQTNPVEASRLLVDIYSKRLKEAYGIDPLSQIQVLCPSKMGELGTFRLNDKLQEMMNPANPSKRELKNSYRLFREGDKVMQVKNNYTISWVNESDSGDGVYNGDIGIIEHIDQRNDSVIINYNGKRADYTVDMMDQLELAYAVTVHKSQGSEFDAVIIPVISVNKKLCYRNLLYTAVTRAKSLLIIIGTEEALNSMIDNNKSQLRYSALKSFLLDKE
ncbi:MAG: ATP-dependent RecD-like DNA helicase [Clostridiales bacterium]|nr:ATP-dependent RecD-like DNA helicase [Clostridiales bacterium]